MAFPASVMRSCRVLVNAAYACIAPSRCRACGSSLFGYENPCLCDACLQAIQWIGDAACAKCGFPADVPHDGISPAGVPPARGRERDGNGCERCRGRNLFLDKVVAVARYKHGVRNMIRSFKYRGETALARPLGGMMAARVRGADFFRTLDLIVPVALHPGRKRNRGFDQARILADVISGETGIMSRSDMIERRRHTVPQAMLHRAERLVNMEGVFAAREGGEAMRGKRILLVDDVMTTGSTMADCARACRNAGAAKVYAVVFAR